MPETVVNNRRIAQNTIFLYFRMIVVMLISLYTVRAFLNILGETNYGLYNVIGGVVGMFSFLNGTLSTSSQRYFSQALVKGNKEGIKKVFCLNLTVYLILIIIIIAFLETIGLWFVNNQMTIPDDRIKAANIVYQISILTFLLQMMSIAYTALVVAYEKMKAFAYIGIFEALLKLGYVFLLSIVSYDKLIAYAVLMFILYFLITALYVGYCRIHFAESKYFFYWNKREAFEMLGFSGWHFLGTLSVVVRSQGVNILINMFFSPAVNAARAIAFQVEGAINKFSDSFFVAVKPQMYKSYSNGEIEALNTLVNRSSIICFFLVSILSVPLFFNTPYILSLWLKNVPDYTIVFTQLVLIEGLIDSVSGSAICPALATGKIKKFYIVTGNLYILSLPIAYIFLKLGCEPTSTMLVSIGISIVCLFARAWLLIDLIHFSIKEYMKLCGKLIFVTLLIGSCTFFTTKMFTYNWTILAVSTIVSSLLHCVLYLFFICSQQDRVIIIRIVNNKLHRNGNQK